MKRILPSFLLAAALLASAAPAHGQLDHLNVDRLIKEMREKGMSDLLIRLANDGSIKNKEDAARLGVEMLIMRAQTPIPTNPTDVKDRIATLEEAVVKFNELIAANRESTKRPLWQADFALHLIYTRMAMNALADDFYEFGMPTPEQAAAFESGAAMAAEHLIDSANFLAKLSRDLPRAADYNQTYVNTGRMEEMMDEYLKTKVPFLLGQAAYMASLLPDTHPYYKNLGKNPNIPLQATTPAEERKRLLNLAVDSLSNIPPEMSTKYGLPPRPINLVKGKALAMLGQFDEAYKLLDTVADQPKDDLLAFRATLARAVAMELKDKKPDAAIALLETLREHPLTQGGIAFPILITDLEHRLLMKHAGGKKELIEAAYKPYDALFTDKRLGDRTEATRMFVYQRWTKQFAGQKQDALPPMVLSGMGEMERLVGNEFVAKWAQFSRAAAVEGASDAEVKEAEASAAAAMKTGREHLDTCIDIADVLINRADVPPEVKARARYNKAYASYLKDPENGLSFLRAAAIWTELANELPTHPLAEEAIGLAVRFLHNLHIQDPRPDGVDAAYRSTCEVLYTKLPESKVAEDERVYYTFHVLQSSGKLQEAADSYNKLSPAHRDYVEAQREWLYCNIQLWREMPENGDKGTRRDKLREEIGRVEAVAKQELEAAGEAKRRAMVKRTLGDLVLMKVELDMHRKEWAEADRVLRNFADDFADEPDLINLALSRRIMVQVKQSQSAKAVELAESLMTSAGEDADKQRAAAGTIDLALAELAEEIEDLRAAADVAPGALAKEEFMKRATDQAEASDKLADMLLNWAEKNKASDDDLFRYRLIKVRSSILTGKAKAAADALAPLIKIDPAEPRVIFLQGEVLFMTGKPEDLRKSLGFFMMLTKEGIVPMRLTPDMPAIERNKQDILNRIWWQSWLRTLQVYDKLNAQTKQIPRLIEQLRLQYPELGGPGMRSKFEQLRNKHSK